MNARRKKTVSTSLSLPKLAKFGSRSGRGGEGDEAVYDGPGGMRRNALRTRQGIGCGKEQVAGERVIGSRNSRPIFRVLVA